jgi:hypothetical protein
MSKLNEKMQIKRTPTKAKSNRPKTNNTLIDYILNFFPEFYIRLNNKNSESDYFFFPPPKSEYFVQQHWDPHPFNVNGRSLIRGFLRLG